MVADLRRRVGLFNPFSGLLLAALLAANAGNARAQDDGPYPVWFPDDIGIVSLDEIPAALRAPFAPGDEIQFEIRGFVRRRGSPPLIWATNCNEYMVYDEGRIYRRRIENDRIGRQVEIWEAHDLRCMSCALCVKLAPPSAASCAIRDGRARAGVLAGYSGR
jgi:hypothetical protein